MYDRYIIKNEAFTKDYDVFAIKYPNDSSILNLYSYNGKLYIKNDYYFALKETEKNKVKQ